MMEKNRAEESRYFTGDGVNRFFILPNREIIGKKIN